MRIQNGSFMAVSLLLLNFATLNSSLLNLLHPHGIEHRLLRNRREISLPRTGAAEETSSKCTQVGDQYVKDFIIYECFGADESVASTNVNMIGRPIGCIPANRSNSSMILPGKTHTTMHFRFECIRDSQNAISLRITHCVDNAGSLVKFGDFFSETKAGEQISVECAGNEFFAKKIVHKWTKCQLENGQKIIEGNFVTQRIENENETLRSQLQQAEIMSCVRNGASVQLRCTGCVTTTGEHVGITNYINILGQWTQCRRYRDGCRLINVTTDYIDCLFENRTITNGNTFTSKSGLSSFQCNQGVITKQGCVLNGELVSVGDVRYLNDRPLLCEQNDQMTSFNGLIGCDLPDGRFKKFLESWQEGNIIKRCSWNTTENGSRQARVISFACMDSNEQVPLNQVIQRPNGEFVKCAQLETNEDELSMRELSEDELEDYITKKKKTLDLMEYHGVGARSSVQEIVRAPPKNSRRLSEENKEKFYCADQLSFCSRLAAYCALSQNSGGLETGLALESYNDFREVQKRFEKLANLQSDPSSPIGCEDQMSPFQKFQVLVEVSCPKTCLRCTTRTEEQQERLISNLEKTSHCG